MAKRDKEIKKEVEKTKQELGEKTSSVKPQEAESMESIFKLNNKQTFSTEIKPKTNKGLALWGTKH